MTRTITLWHVWDEGDPATRQRFCLTVKEAREVSNAMDNPSSIYVTTVQMTKRGIAHALNTLPLS